MKDRLALQRTLGAVPGLVLVLAAEPGFPVLAASAGYRDAVQGEGAPDAGLFDRPLHTLFAAGETATLAALQASLARVVATRCADTLPPQTYRLQGPAGPRPPRFWRAVNTPVPGDDGTVVRIVHHVQDAAPSAERDAVAILDSVTEGFYTLDRQWRFGYVNREACRILDRRPGELAGQVVWEAYPGLEGSEIEHRYQRAMLHGEKGAFTAYYAAHERWYEITVYPVSEGISVFFRDVSAQKAVQAQRDALLAASEQQRRIFETALDSTPDLVSVIETDGRIRYANAALRRAWGVADPRGKQWADLGYRPDQAAQHEADIARVVASRAAVRGEMAFSGAEGTHLYDYIFAPVPGETGEVVAVVGTARDITERQQMTERLAASQRLEAIGTLAGGVAHDFNNMLAVILTNLGLAVQEGNTLAAAERLQLARRAAERARSLVRQILTFSRRAAGAPQVQRLAPLIDEALALLRSTLPPAVRLVVRHAAAQAAAAEVDAAQFQQLVVNLCTNAWQALADGRGTVRVSLMPLALPPAEAAALELPAGDYLRLRVADDGVGMDEAVRTHVFEPFFTTKPVGSGTGLGLAVVHGVVKECGGAIRVHSRPGRGTLVSVFLPLRAAPAAVPLAAGPVPGAAPGGRAGRLLYVDDDEIVALSATALLQQAGFEVSCAPDAASALAAVQGASVPFDVVVTDQNMPGLSGLALAEALRTQAPGTAVVIASGLVSDELRAAAAACGVREVVLKEYMLERLADAVRRALAQAPSFRNRS